MKRDKSGSDEMKAFAFNIANTIDSERNINPSSSSTINLDTIPNINRPTAAKTVPFRPPTKIQIKDKSSTPNISSTVSQQPRPRPPNQPNRTTRTSQKLVVFPDQSVLPESQVADVSSEYGDENANSGANVVHYPYEIVKEKEAERFRRLDMTELPRVTAYCTAKSYSMGNLNKCLVSLQSINGTRPRIIDECIYTPYTPSTQYTHRSPVPPPSFNANRDGALNNFSFNDMENEKSLLLDSYASQNTAAFNDTNAYSDPDLLPRKKASISSYKSPKLSRVEVVPPAFSGEIFFFDYGVVVMWGLREVQEMHVLSLLAPYEEDKLTAMEVETEEFRFQYRPHSQPRIFNDVIILRGPQQGVNQHLLSNDVDLASDRMQSNRYEDPEHTNQQDQMIKLTISHAIAQSVKLTLFEGLIEHTINTTKHIPIVMANTGKVHMTRTAITRKIGQLFIMRINVNLVSPILDTPEIFWSEPSLEPLYAAIRGYLEISQRVELLNQRCSVISDLLDMLKEHLNSAHGEKLEWIIIVLIAIEILIGLVTILFDFLNLYQKP